MAAFILVRLSSLFGLAKMSAAFLKMYQLGLIASVAAFLTRWRGGLQKRLSLSLKEDDPLWIRRVKNTYNQAAGRVYLGLIFSFFAIAGLDLAGYERAARFSLYAILESLLAIALAAAIWFFWGRLFQQISTLAEKYVQHYPDMEKEIRQSLAWMSRFARLIIITLALVVIMTIWKIDILGFLSRRASLLFRLVRIPAIILIAIFSIQAVMLLIRRAAQRVAKTRIQKGEGIPAEIEKQMKTISGMLCKVAAVFIWAAAGTMILNELGFSIGPLLAGAGVVGLAVGFGAQNLVRDILSGIFIIVENQVRVGDVAILNGIGGLVEAVNLRTTILRGLDGTVHVFPNGTINTVANMTHGFAYYVFDIGVAYKENIDRVYAVLRQIGDQIIQEEPYRSMILEPLEILGVDRFADSAVIIKARIKTQPIKQWVVGREINRRIKERFDQEGIEIPFPHRTFYFGEQSKPIEVNIRNIGDLGGLRDSES
ncbi:MAG: mechanosensitive ion channel family protein [bacterium]|nr:mechanosensitive ion channel family protein [bacterium]